MKIKMMIVMVVMMMMLLLISVAIAIQSDSNYSLVTFKGRLYECHSTVESTQLANLSRLNVKTIA